MNPDEEEALYLPSDQEGCTDGTLTFLSGKQPQIKEQVIISALQYSILDKYLPPLSCSYTGYLECYH